jgi:hypothetical protein
LIILAQPTYSYNPLAGSTCLTNSLVSLVEAALLARANIIVSKSMQIVKKPVLSRVFEEMILHSTYCPTLISMHILD